MRSRIGEHGQRAEQARMEAEAHYIDRKIEKDEKSAFLFHTTTLSRDELDYRKAFDEASESSRGLSA